MTPIAPGAIPSIVDLHRKTGELADQPKHKPLDSIQQPRRQIGAVI